MGLLIAFAAAIYWAQYLMPFIKTSEQAKSEVLMLYALNGAEEAVDSGDEEALGHLVSRLMLMEDPKTGKKLFLGVTISLLGGEEVTARDLDLVSPVFPVSAPIYSKTSQELRGEIEIIYNDYQYNLLAEDAKRKLVYVLFGLALFTFMAYRFAVYLLAPLSALASSLSKMEFKELGSLPAPEGYVTEEVRRVAQALDDLLKGISEAWQSERAATVSKHYLDNILSSMSDILLVLGPDHRIEKANKAACELLGYEEESIEGLKADEIFVTPEGKGFEEFLAGSGLLEQESVRNLEMPLRRKDGGWFPALVAASIMRGDSAEARGIVCAAKDITQLKEAERELKEAKNKAEDATKLKDRFVALVSHDLKSPLSSIRMSVDLIKMTTDDLPKDAHENLSRIQQIIEHMVEMIKELLDLSRLQTGKIKLNHEVLDAHHSIQNVFYKMSGPSAKKEVKMVNDVPQKTLVYADPILFHQVIQNLVVNAIKFSTPGGAVTVFIPDDGKGNIAVKDTGVGIRKEFLPNLFSAEVKTTTIGTAGEKGSGLGLPLCNEIIKAHNGSISVESQDGAGTVFYLTFPQKDSSGQRL